MKLFVSVSAKPVRVVHLAGGPLSDATRPARVCEEEGRRGPLGVSIQPSRRTRMSKYNKCIFTFRRAANRSPQPTAAPAKNTNAEPQFRSRELTRRHAMSHLQTER